MIAVVRSEWIKFRTVRMNTVLAAFAVAIPLIIVGLASLLVGLDGIDPFSTADLVNLVLNSSIVTALLIAVIGATGITNEFAFNTIRPTFAATPKRTRVVVAKAIVTAITGLIVQAVVVLGVTALGEVILRNRGADVDTLAQSSLRAPMLGMILFGGIVALFGLGMGLVVRSTPAAVALVVLWPLIIENLIGFGMSAAGWEDGTRWLPYQAGLALGQIDVGSGSLGRVGGGLWFLLFVVIILVVGTVITQRRDA